MSSWPTETKHISHSTTRIDAPAKLTGKARYSSDIQADGWLYGMILRSKWPSAKILSVTLENSLLRRGNCRRCWRDQACLPRCVARH
jgi:xanthine dehydrogenase YagR molybdenum-binding subunit